MIACQVSRFSCAGSPVSQGLPHFFISAFQHVMASSQPAQARDCISRRLQPHAHAAPLVHTQDSHTCSPPTTDTANWIPPLEYCTNTREMPSYDSVANSAAKECSHAQIMTCAMLQGQHSQHVAVHHGTAAMLQGCEVQ